MKALASILIAIILSVSFLWHATDGAFALTSEAARRHLVANSQPVIPNIKVETMTGQYQTLVDPRKKVTIVEFIYTTCPYICQADGANLSQLSDRLTKQGLSSAVRILSVSFDPQTDGVAELAYYGGLHEADGDIWTVVRPEIEELPILLDAFGVTVIPDQYGGYQHNSAMHLVNRKERLFAIFDTDDLDGAVAAIRKYVQ